MFILALSCRCSNWRVHPCAIRANAVQKGWAEDTWRHHALFTITTGSVGRRFDRKLVPVQSGTPLRWWRSNVRRPPVVECGKNIFRDTKSELDRADSIGQRDVAKSLLSIAVHRLSGTVGLTGKVTS
jgi:hypothetical protein